MRAWHIVVVGGLAGCARLFGIESQTIPSVDAPPIDAAPTPGAWTSVVGGNAFTCAIADDKSLWCWGRNDLGQLGIPMLPEADSPTRVGDASWLEISAKVDHACGIQTDQTLWCWGFARGGPIPVAGDVATTPTKVDGIWAHVAVGADQTCAIAGNGSLSCSGSNDHGQLLALANPQLTLAAIDPGPWRAIASGDQTLCALKPDGTLWCWGANDYGETGTPGQSAQAMILEVDHAEAPWSDVAMAGASTCAITASHRLRCFGDNRLGQLGDETVNSRVTPMPVGHDLDLWDGVSLGGFSACGHTTTGATKCWGDNNYLQLANPDFASYPFRTLPDPVPGAWSSMAMVFEHACAIDATTHALFCAGNGGGGQLGDGKTGSARAPVQIAAGDQVDTGFFATCAIAGGALSCWGFNGYGTVGDKTLLDRPAPSPIAGTWSAVSVGTHACAIDNAGALWCWGNDDHFQLGLGNPQQMNQSQPRMVTAIAGGWRAIATSKAHTCGFGTDGTLYCWGDNGSGQCGQTAGVPVQTPTTVGGPWKMIAVGDATTCGIDANKQVECFGEGGLGQRGDGASGQTSMPSLVLGPITDTEVSLGQYFGCSAGTALDCWGYDNVGQLGNQTTSGGAFPQVVPGTWSHVSAGDDHACGIAVDRSLWCWGANSTGALGDGSFLEHHSPVRVGTDTWASVSAGLDHTCAVRDDHTIWCWGGNFYGQLGDGTAWRSALVQTR